jgi:hypothetical protein
MQVAIDFKLVCDGHSGGNFEVHLMAAAFQLLWVLAMLECFSICHSDMHMDNIHGIGAACQLLLAQANVI